LAAYFKGTFFLREEFGFLGGDGWEIKWNNYFSGIFQVTIN